MSQQARDLFTISFPSAAAVTAANRLVDYSGAVATVQAQKVLGPAKRPAAINQPFEVPVIGTAIVEAGAAFAVGASLISDNVGRAIVTAAGTDYIFGDALQAATQAGDLVEVLLRR